jgi:uncharacterized protein (TIGR03435 family)
MRSFRIAALACLAAFTALAQPAFEVASVKPSTDNDHIIGLFTYPGGRVVATRYTLKMLIHDAYNLQDQRIQGGPRWVGEDLYNLEAKPPKSSESSHWAPASFKTPPNPEMRQMLQTLLADRFQLKMHAETKKEPVYALVVAKGGPKLKPPDTAKEPFVSLYRNGSPYEEAVSHAVRGQNATMAQLAAHLGPHFGRPVLDQTGLKGNFDFEVEYAEGESQAQAAEPLLRALQDQLGLKLETQPGSVEVLVIDRAEKPSAN